LVCENIQDWKSKEVFACTCIIQNRYIYAITVEKIKTEFGIGCYDEYNKCKNVCIKPVRVLR
jgi:hypothetical protein